MICACAGLSQSPSTVRTSVHVLTCSASPAQMLTRRCVRQLLLACPVIEELAMEVTRSNVQAWATHVERIMKNSPWPLGSRAPPLRHLELVTRGQLDLQTLWCAC